MNRAEIIAELRRSAYEDANPWRGIGADAFSKAYRFLKWPKETCRGAPHNMVRLFYLIVAEALS